jgi:hypothetical protein
MSDRETRCYSGEVRAEQQGEHPRELSVTARCLTVAQNPSGDSAKLSNPALSMMCWRRYPRAV